MTSLPVEQCVVRINYLCWLFFFPIAFPGSPMSICKQEILSLQSGTDGFRRKGQFWPLDMLAGRNCLESRCCYKLLWVKHRVLWDWQRNSFGLVECCCRCKVQKGPGELYLGLGERGTALAVWKEWSHKVWWRISALQKLSNCRELADKVRGGVLGGGRAGDFKQMAFSVLGLITREQFTGTLKVNKDSNG